MSERHCPRCLVALRGAKGPTMVVDMCGECGGAFFDLGELSRLVRKQQEAFAKLEALVESDAAEAVPMAETGRLRCPGCGKPMERYEYAYCSKIMLDRCAECGGILREDEAPAGECPHCSRPLVAAAEMPSGSVIGGRLVRLAGYCADQAALGLMMVPAFYGAAVLEATGRRGPGVFLSAFCKHPPRRQETHIEDRKGGLGCFRCCFSPSESGPSRSPTAF